MTTPVEAQAVPAPNDAEIADALRQVEMAVRFAENGIGPVKDEALGFKLALVTLRCAFAPGVTRPTPAAAAPWNVDDLMQLVFRYGAARLDVDRSNSAGNQRACNEAIDAIRNYVRTLVAASPAAAAPQPLNVQPWPPGSSMLQVAVAPHAAAGPYPTAMRPATAEEAAAIASRFGGAEAAAGVPTGWKLPEGCKVESSFHHVGNCMVEPTVTVTLPAINSEDGDHRMWTERDRIAALLASSPGAPVGAPTDEQPECICSLADIHWECPLHGAKNDRRARGCKLATDATLTPAMPTAPRTQSAPPAPCESEVPLPRTADSTPQEQWLDRYPTYCACQLCLAAQSRL